MAHYGKNISKWLNCVYVCVVVQVLAKILCVGSHLLGSDFFL